MQYYCFPTTLLFVAVVILPHHCTQLPELYSYYDIHKVHDDMTECKRALENFALSSSNYTLCTLNNAHPIHMCEKCVSQYVNVTISYDTILTVEDNGIKCKEKLLNLDRLGIVESIFNGLKNLWDRGYCSKCFTWNNSTYMLSNETKTFIKYFNEIKTCINSHYHGNSNDTDICTLCMEEYLRLNSYYESLKGLSETTGICMDIVDSMNATRSVWSGVLNCCKLRQTPEIFFLSCSAFIAVFPALFYFAVRIFSAKASRIQVIGQHHFEESFENMPGPSHPSIQNS